MAAPFDVFLKVDVEEEGRRADELGGGIRIGFIAVIAGAIWGACWYMDGEAL